MTSLSSSSATFLVQLKAVAWSRPRANFQEGKKLIFNKKQLTEFKNDFRAAAPKLPFIFEGPLKLSIVCHFTRPKTNKERFPIGRPDVDNFSKAIMDAMNPEYLRYVDPQTKKTVRILSGWRGFWRDDAQVVSLAIDKVWVDSDPFIRVELTQL